MEKTIKVTKNLINTKVNGGEYSKPILIKGKLNPHVKDISNKINSALY